MSIEEFENLPQEVKDACSVQNRFIDGILEQLGLKEFSKDFWPTIPEVLKSYEVIDEYNKSSHALMNSQIKGVSKYRLITALEFRRHYQEENLHSMMKAVDFRNQITGAVKQGAQDAIRFSSKNQ